MYDDAEYGDTLKSWAVPTYLLMLARCLRSRHIIRQALCQRLVFARIRRPRNFQMD